MATVEFENDPFSEGSSRWVYRGVKKLPGGEREWFVLKRFKRGYYSQYSRYKHTNLDVVAMTAQQLAGRFNMEASIPLSIYFLEPLKQVNIEKLNYGIEWVAVERFLDGEYTKWLSNAGWVNQQEMGEGGSLPAFSHWTWVVTKGHLLVCDLQGVKDDKRGYWLTDPAIHSISRKYGQTDLGKIGINQFFMTHKCNEVCQLLRLEDRCPTPIVPKYSQWLSEYRSTVYYNEIVWMYKGKKDDGYYDMDYDYDFAGVKNDVSSRKLPEHIMLKVEPSLGNPPENRALGNPPENPGSRAPGNLPENRAPGNLPENRAPGNPPENRALRIPSENLNPVSRAPGNPLPSNQLSSEQERLLSRFNRAEQERELSRFSRVSENPSSQIQGSVRLGITLILVTGGAISGHIIATTLGTSGDIHSIVGSVLVTIGGGLGAAVGCKFGGFIGNELGGDFGVEFIGSLMGGTLGGLGGVFSTWILWCRI